MKSEIKITKQLFFSSKCCFINAFIYNYESEVNCIHYKYLKRNFQIFVTIPFIFLSIHGTTNNLNLCLFQINFPNQNHNFRKIISKVKR